MIPPPNEPLILRLDSPDATLERVGGKGASLARMSAARLPVPPGFYLTTSAYDRFVEENQLQGLILSAAAQAKPDNPSTLEDASAQIQSFFAQARIPADIADLISRSYQDLGTGDPPAAVRSSATAEDLPGMSFAGQQETYLNVRGAQEVVEAVKRCWASLWTARAIGYRAQQGIRSEDVALAVVIQELVPADAAGILFTANPVTGAREQVLINAAWGLGEAIVGGLVTPDTFVVNKQSGALESKQIVDKTIMTVRLPQGTREEHVPAGRRRKASIRPRQALQLASLAAQIEDLYGQPMDVEWALSGGQFFILQARPITALPEPPVTLEWKLPRPGGYYYRSSAIELLPDPLSPLFATLALPLWNDVTRSLMAWLGFGGIMPEEMLLTINDYAYYDFGISPLKYAQMCLALPGTIRKVWPAEERWVEAHSQDARIVNQWSTLDLEEAPAARLLEGAGELVSAAADHYLTIQSGILPAAYTSELIFTLLYNHLLKRKQDPPALAFLLGFESAPIQAEKSLYDLAAWAGTQPDLADYLARESSATIAEAYLSTPETPPHAHPEGPSPPDTTEHENPIAENDKTPQSDGLSGLSTPPSIGGPGGPPSPPSIGGSGIPLSPPSIGGPGGPEFCSRLREHLNRFGHTIYDLDFARPLPAEDPAPLIETLKYFLTGQARSPYERQATAAAARERATRTLLSRWKGFLGRWLRGLVQWMQRYAPLREDALADIGLGYPLLRRMLREIGRRMVEAGAIADRDDVFWLKLEEIAAAARVLDANQPAPDVRQVVKERRATWESERKVTPPVMLPPRARFLGMDFSNSMPARTGQTWGSAIKGQGASPGRVSGIARVIHGPDEFSQMRQGDILVAKITTPAWTPLFVLAAGVVTDVGGPLSHSSIVAREYHIPAVLGTGVATERIHSGDSITVDGDAGIVTIGPSR